MKYFFTLEWIARERHGWEVEAARHLRGSVRQVRPTPG
jgi:hypothetical protein